MQLAGAVRTRAVTSPAASGNIAALSDESDCTRRTVTSGYDAVLASEQDTTGSDLRVLRKPYKQAELARALRDVLAA
jgi:hypothetical protein